MGMLVLELMLPGGEGIWEKAVGRKFEQENEEGFNNDLVIFFYSLTLKMLINSQFCDDN